MSNPPRKGLRQAIGVLRPGPFRRYMLGESISSTGTWMQMMAQSWVMTSLTHSAFMLGMVNFASGVPQLLLTMIGGSFADRYDKRRIMLVAQVVQIALAVLTGYLIATGRIQLWHIIAMAVVLGVSNSFEMPAASALVPELVEAHEIGDAIAVDRASFHATRLIGPSLAGLMIGWWGTASAFYANALSFVALMLALASLKPRPVGTEEEEELRRGGMKDGFRYVLSDRPTWAMIGMSAMSTVLVFPALTILLPLYARDVIGMNASTLGLMMGLSGVGSLTGAIALLRVHRHQRLACIALAVAGITTGLALLSMSSSIPLIGFALVLSMLCTSTMIGLVNTTVQERAPEHLRGRVSAIAGISFFGLMPLAGLVITGTSDLIGMRLTMGLAAALFAVGAGAMLVGPARGASDAAPVREAVAAEAP